MLEVDREFISLIKPNKIINDLKEEEKRIENL